MKKIILVNNNLDLGGVQSSLISLINEIADKYEVTLFLFNLDKNARQKIPANVNLISAKFPFKYLGMSSSQAKKHWLDFVARSFFAIVTKMFGRSAAIFLMLPFQKRIKGYDVAISFLHEGSRNQFYGGCNDFVLKKVCAAKKIAWIHCDISQSGGNNRHSHKIYRKYNKIIACSKGTMQKFQSCFPELSDKCDYIRNCINYNRIKEQLNVNVKYDNSFLNIITVARLSYEKGIDRGLIAISEALKYNPKIIYHIVGEGVEKEKLQKMCHNLKIDDNVIFYGGKDNPYPEMASADLLFLPSFHEAAPIVFDEAAYLGVPVLATKTLSTDEMIVSNNSGFVCENNQNSINDMLIKIATDQQLIFKIKKDLCCRDYNNQSIVTKFTEII